MIHSFDTDDAKKYGVEGAIILWHLAYWIKKNAANNRHYYDGNYWTYNSAKAFVEIFPYWSDRKIYRILNKLEQAGAIITGNYNENQYDRTKWYAISDESILEKWKIQLTKTENGIAENVEPIPYNYIPYNYIPYNINSANQKFAQDQKKKKTQKEKKEKEIDIWRRLASEIFGSEAEKWLELWLEWINYKKKEHRFRYKSERYMRKAMQDWAELARNESRLHDLEKAKKIIDQSIANGYKGLFALKKTTKKTPGKVFTGRKNFRG